MNSQLLISGAEAFGLELDDRAIERFSLFLDELKRWNRAINLTAIKKDDPIIIKHFVDSLSIAPHIDCGSSLLDIGSGAGMPCLPVAIIRSDLSITSIDAIDKKARFQRHVCRLLELDNVNVLHDRVEKLAEDQPESFDVVTSRAFRDIDRFLQLSYELVRPSGLFIAMIAGARKSEACTVDKTIMGELNLTQIEISNYALPQGMGNHSLVLIRKNISNDRLVASR
jgi:16S rRNA (guanine527-N7)-methyltransferase